MCSDLGLTESAAGILGVNKGEKSGVVGVGEGLKETKKTALVHAPETF